MRSHLSRVLLASTLFLACAKGSSLDGGQASGAGGDRSTSSSGSPSSASSGSSGSATGGATSASSGMGGATGSSSSSGASAGTGGCSPGTNTDGDGMDDCTEIMDGDPWTDPTIFNGMHVRWAKQCSAFPSCPQIDTLAEVDACVAGTPVIEEQDQYSGWDWPDSPDGICSPGYNFQPPWKQCNNIDNIRWQADWQGYINLGQSGQHCFAALGVADESCAAIYFNAETTGVTQVSGAACYNLPAGVYPIRWYYEMDNGSHSDMHIAYCFGGGAACSPSAAIPASMLRVKP